MLNMTKQEQQVILFICALALTGLGVSYLLKSGQHPQLLPCFEKELGKLDLNRADRDSLMRLPGIGKELAGRIIDHRRQCGGFTDIRELMKVKGITEARFNKLKGLLFTGGE